MSYLDWHVGMKVVCLRGQEYDRRYHGASEALTVKGEVYTIREIGKFNPHFPAHVTVRFMELRNKPWARVGVSYPLETFFYAHDFKPIQARATDISIFTQMLNPSKVDA